VQQAPGIPCALFFWANDLQTSGAMRRENAETYLSTSSRPSEARAGTHNHECLYCAMLQLQLYLHLASVAMGPCFRRDDATTQNNSQQIAPASEWQLRPLPLPLMLDNALLNRRP
jgi:hypothetical protein